jgi:hypothetical protein
MVVASETGFSQFVDLLLVGLHDAEPGSTGRLIDLYAIADQLRTTVPPDWVVDAAKVMQSRGLALVSINSRGCYARLTGEGRLYVEQRKGTGIIDQYRQDPHQFVQHVHVSGSSNNVVVGAGMSDVQQDATGGQENARILEVLRDMERRVKADATLGDAERDDALSDVESVRTQLRKGKPNRTVLAALLDSLGRIASIGVQVMTLIKMING